MVDRVDALCLYGDAAVSSICPRLIIQYASAALRGLTDGGAASLTGVITVLGIATKWINKKL